MKKSIFFWCYQPRYKKEKKEGKELLPFAEQAIIYAKNDGLEGIEILPGRELMSEDGREYAKVLRERLDKEGIECACYSYGISMLNDPKYALSELLKSVDIAKTLGSPFLHHTFQVSFSFKGVPKELTFYQNAEKIFVDIGKEVAYYAGENGLDCIYEDQGYFVNTVDRMGGLINKIDMSNTGFCLDMGNSLFYDVKPESFAGAFAPIIKHVHVKDYILNTSPDRPSGSWDGTISGNWLKNCIVGTGIVEMQKIFRIILSQGYDGYFSLENQDAVSTLTDEQGDAAIAKSFENIQRAYDRAFESVNRN